MPTQLDFPQVLKGAYDEANQALQVSVVAQTAAGSTVEITDGSGSGDKVSVTVANALKVDGSATTQPVSVASLPLPSGAATSDNQTSELTKLDTLHTDLGVIEGKQDTGNTSLASIDGKTNANTLSTGNSTTTPLGASETFTGTTFDATGYSSILVNVSVDQEGTLFVDYSRDGSNWDISGGSEGPLTGIVPGTPVVHTFQFGIDAQYVRIRLQNSTTPQGFFELQTIFKKVSPELGTKLADGAGNLLTSTTVGFSQALDVNIVGEISLSPPDVTGSVTNVNDAVTLSYDDKYSTVVIEVSGTWTGAIVMKALGINSFVAVPVYNATTNASLTSITTNGTYYVIAAGGTGTSAVLQGSPSPTGTANIEMEAFNSQAAMNVAIATLPPISSTFDTAGTSTLSNVNSSATSVSILASNTSRKSAYFFNDSTSVLYLKFGTTASATSYTLQIQPNGFFEMPSKPVYTGAIDGIWSSANGSVRTTELS